MSFLHRLLPPLILLSLSACSLDRPVQPGGMAVSHLVAPPLPAELKRLEEAYFDVLVAETALHRQRRDVAVRYYLEAARVSRDPKVARQATRVALYAQDVPAAIRAARYWVEEEPEAVEAHSTLALLLFRNGQMDEALRQLRRTLELAGEQRGQRFAIIARLLVKEEDATHALELMGRLVSEYPDDPAARYAYARLAQEYQRLDLALKELAAALELKPEWPQAVVLKAQILLDRGRLDEAVEAMRVAVEQTPGDRALQITYGRLLAEAGRRDQALAHFDRLLERWPDDGEVLYTAALVNLDARRYAEAEGQLRRLLEAGRRGLEVHFYLGVALMELGRDQEAIQEFQRVREGDLAIRAQISISSILARQGKVDEALRQLWHMRPSGEAFTVRLFIAEADILLEVGRYEQAMETVNRGLERFPDNVDLLYSRAIVAEKLGRLDILEADLLKVLEMDPDNAHALNTLGYTLADRTDRYEEARGYIERAYALMPNEAAIIDSMGWVLYRLGRLEESLEYLQRAWRLDRDPEIGAHLGEVLWRLDRRDEARAVWQEALEVAPGSTIVTETMSRLER